MSRYLQGNNIETLPLPLPKEWSPKSFFENMTDEQWRKIIWGKVEKRVFGLQKRIYKATKLGLLSLAKSLTKLLLRSSSSILLNVRRITQDNSGKKTAGVDGKTFLSMSARRQLVCELMEEVRKGIKGYKADAIRRVYIPKANGKRRPLGIPTKKDAVRQGIVKTTLEPYWEAVCEAESFGFRLAYCTHDAIEAIFNNINHQQKWVLDADIKGCFDNITHDFILQRIPTRKMRTLVKQWLKAGVVDGLKMIKPTAGTPQGGVISPLLANIALDGMSCYLKAEIEKVYGLKTAVKLKVIRYADDFLVIHASKEIVEYCQERLKSWLALRGLELSQEKTSIVHTSDGFDFLGFNVRQYPKPKTGYYARMDKGKLPYKTLIKPSQAAISKQKAEIGTVVDQMRGQSQDKLIERLNPKIQGWVNYYRHVVSSQVFSEMDHWLWHKTYRWSRRRHPNKGRRWVYRKYYRRIKNRTSQFASQTHALVQHRATRIERYIRIQSGRSVYDGDEIYWASRLTRGYGDITPSQARLLRKQNGQCMHCHQAFHNGDKMEIHHLKARSEGGTDRYENLALLHKHCHDQYHALVLEQRQTERRTNVNLASSYREMSDIQASIMGIV